MSWIIYALAAIGALCLGVTLLGVGLLVLSGWLPERSIEDREDDFTC